MLQGGSDVFNTQLKCKALEQELSLDCLRSLGFLATVHINRWKGNGVEGM